MKPNVAVLTTPLFLIFTVHYLIILRIIDLLRICASNSIFLFTTMEYLVQFLQGVMAAIFQLTIRVLLRAGLRP